ncbi:MAG: hypothetical protein COB53_00250 [Elusimicrobia bacterium]|nr:MAG: hypothetical protein COB53_00250 [Elusimicrobiota bacterium]
MTRFDDPQEFDALLAKSMACLPVLTPSANFDMAVLNALGFKPRTHWAAAGVLLCAAYAAAVGILIHIIPWDLIPGSALHLLLSVRPVIEIGVRVLHISLSQLALGSLPFLVPAAGALSLALMSAALRPQSVRNSL